MPTAITERSIRALRPTSVPQELRDTEVRGFIYRVNAARKDGSATRGFYVEYGRGKRLKIGEGALLTPKRARGLAKAVLGAVAEGRNPREALKNARSPNGKELTLSEFLSDRPDAPDQRYGFWVKIHRRSGEQTLSRLHSCFDSFGNCTLPELGPAVIDRWRTQRLTAGVKPETINREVAALRAALSKALDWGYIEINPLAGFRRLPTDRHKKTQRALTVEEEAQLLEALEAREKKRREARASGNDWRRRRNAAELPELYNKFTDHLLPAVLLSLKTGIRRGELLSLEWNDIDLENKVLTVRGEIAKSGHTRRIELNKTAFSALQRWKLQTGTSRLVFASHDGRGFHSLRKGYYSALELAGIDRNHRGSVTWHSLRHTFGTRLASAGVPPHTVQALMGHSDLKTTMRYFHVTEDERRTAVQRLDDFCNARPWK